MPFETKNLGKKSTMIEHPSNPFFVKEKLEPINTCLRAPKSFEMGKENKQFVVTENVEELKERLREQANVHKDLWDALIALRNEHELAKRQVKVLSEALTDKEEQVNYLNKQIAQDQSQLAEITTSFEQLKLEKTTDKGAEALLQKLSYEKAQVVSENNTLKCQLMALQRDNASLRWNMQNTLEQMRRSHEYTKREHEKLANESYAKIVELHQSLERKRMEISEFDVRRRMNDDRIAKILREHNIEVNQIIINFITRLRKTSIDVAAVQSVTATTENVHASMIDREINILNFNMTRLLKLLDVVAENCLYLDPRSGKRKSWSEAYQEDLDSSFSEISVTVKETLDDILRRTSRPVGQCQYSNRLDIDLDDHRNMTMKELEEKFTILSMNLTIDLTTYKKRMEVKREQYNQFTLAFFQHLINILKLAMNAKDPFKCQDNLKSLVHSVDHLKNTAVEVFEAAEEFGVLQYEYRNIKCWRLATNYVGLLSKQLKSK